jgi:hypothetical protein
VANPIPGNKLIHRLKYNEAVPTPSFRTTASGKIIDESEATGVVPAKGFFGAVNVDALGKPLFTCGGLVIFELAIAVAVADDDNTTRF